MTLKDHNWKSKDGTDIRIYRTQPQTFVAHPGLIIFPSIFGITKELADHADKLAATDV